MSSHRSGFWREAFALQGSITPHVAPLVLVFGAVALGICLLSSLVERMAHAQFSLEISPYEIAGAGALLGLLLVLRTNAGYDRWWEARKLWGGIVNQSRNLAISALAYGPDDAAWRERFVQWVAVFPYVARNSLRGEPPSVEVAALVGRDEAEALRQSVHMPSQVALRLGEMLREACDELQMDRFVFLQIDYQRALLIDHVGACERILKTPLPLVYAIKIRRFIVLFLVTLPFALLHRVGGFVLIPLITMLVAYPLLALDQIGVELQNPFSQAHLSHLPLRDISATIERSVTGMLRESRDRTADAASPQAG